MNSMYYLDSNDSPLVIVDGSPERNWPAQLHLSPSAALCARTPKVLREWLVAALQHLDGATGTHDSARAWAATHVETVRPGVMDPWA